MYTTEYSICSVVPAMKRKAIVKTVLFYTIYIHVYNSGHASERDFVRIDFMGKSIRV